MIPEIDNYISTLTTISLVASVVSSPTALSVASKEALDVLGWGLWFTLLLPPENEQKSPNRS